MIKDRLQFLQEKTKRWARGEDVYFHCEYPVENYLIDFFNKEYNKKKHENL